MDRLDGGFILPVATTSQLGGERKIVTPTNWKAMYDVADHDRTMLRRELVQAEKEIRSLQRSLFHANNDGA